MIYGVPRRVVCLTEETTETIYALGAEDLLVGISGFAVRPARARKEKPKVSTFLDAKFDEILALKPDLVFAWSDLQADISAELIRRGVSVVCFNHRTVEGILEMIAQLGALLGKAPEAHAYIDALQRRLDTAADLGSYRAVKPRVYFEEWYDPLITGICWVSEIIEICGGVDVFSENRVHPNAKERILADPLEPIRRNPDIMLTSWCGKMLKPERVISRPGWAELRPYRTGFLRDIPSSVILQPGPAALTDGVDSISAIFTEWEHAGRP